MPLVRRLRKRRPESGFTLIELVIALLLLAILMSASLYAILQGLGLSQRQSGPGGCQRRRDPDTGAARVDGSLTSTGFATIPGDH